MSNIASYPRLVAYKYTQNIHFDDLSAISKLRELFYNIENVPQIGYVAYEDNMTRDPDKMIAAGFLRQCEGNYAIFDGLITNPEVAASVRSEAIDMVVECLINTAKSLKINKIIGFSTDKNTLIRALKFGFTHLDQTVFYKRVD